MLARAAAQTHTPDMILHTHRHDHTPGMILHDLRCKASNLYPRVVSPCCIPVSLKHKSPHPNTLLDFTHRHQRASSARRCNPCAMRMHPASPPAGKAPTQPIPCRYRPLRRPQSPSCAPNDARSHLTHCCTVGDAALLKQQLPPLAASPETHLRGSLPHSCPGALRKRARGSPPEETHPRHRERPPRPRRPS
jgi:hypothetical protein